MSRWFVSACVPTDPDSSCRSSGSTSPGEKPSREPWTFIVTSDDLEPDDLSLDLDPFKVSSSDNDSDVDTSHEMELLSPPRTEEPRRLSVDPDALLEVLNSSNFNKEAIRDFFSETLGDAVQQEEIHSARQEEERPLLELHFTKGLRDKTVEAGRDFALTVEVSHADLDAEWSLDELDLIPQNSAKYTFVSEGRVHVLIVHDANPDDEGDYACAVDGSETAAFITVHGRWRTCRDAPDAHSAAYKT